MPLTPAAYAALCDEPHIVAQCAALDRLLTEHRARNATSLGDMAEALLTDVNAARGIPAPARLSSLAARRAMFGAFDGRGL